MKIFSCICKVSDCVDFNISIIEDLNKNRMPMPETAGETAPLCTLHCTIHCTIHCSTSHRLHDMLMVSPHEDDARGWNGLPTNQRVPAGLYFLSPCAESVARLIFDFGVCT